jgi:hypothetical protein
MSPRANMWLALALLAGLSYGLFGLPHLLEWTYFDEGFVEAELDLPVVPPELTTSDPPARPPVRIRRMKIYSSLPAQVIEFEMPEGKP